MDLALVDRVKAGNELERDAIVQLVDDLGFSKAVEVPRPLNLVPALVVAEDVGDRPIFVGERPKDLVRDGGHGVNG